MRIEELQAKINGARDLDFGSIFNKSIDLFKKVWVQGLLTVIITSSLMIPFYLLMYLPLIAMGIIDTESFQQEPPFSIIMFIPFFMFLILFMCVAMFISVALQAAFFRICMQKDLGNGNTDDYFYFFKKRYLTKILVLALSSVGISLLSLLMLGLPIIYLMVPLSYFSIMFAFNSELSTGEIIKLSFQIGNKKWLLTFGLLIISSILAQIVGLLMCCIGVLVTASFVHLPIYFIYKEVIGFEDESEMDQMGEIQEF